MKKCPCGNDMEDWQTICKQCFAKSKNGVGAKNKDKEIKRQVFLKVASEQVKTKEPKELLEYAQKLEKEFNLWV